MRRIHLPKIMLIPALLAALSFGLTFGISAQGKELSVSILQVDSSAFPLVTAYVTVLDENNTPLIGLTADHFAVTEDGKVVAEPLVVEGDTTQGVDLVLALDVSTEQAMLDKVKEAIHTFADALATEDRVAVVTFANDVQAVENFVSWDEALGVVDELPVRGSYTTLNEAAVDVAELAVQGPLGRGAAVILTDSADNAGALGLEDALDQLAEADVPLYIIGFGPKMSRPEAQDIKRLAVATGGQCFLVSSVDEIPAPLQAFGVLLHQGYKITFASQLPADRGEHALAIQVTGVEGDGSAESTFTAFPGQVTVRAMGLDDGQTVGGVVLLSASVAAPAPVVSVEYLLDDQLLAVVEVPPYPFAWNSAAVEPGAHTLTIRAVDRSGNQGETHVEANVVPAVVVSDIVSPNRVDPGGEIVIEAQISALADVASVDLLLDGKSLGSMDAVDRTSYRFTLDTESHLPGDHLLTVRAVDVLGRVGESSLAVQFVAPPTPAPTPTPTPTPTPSYWREGLKISAFGGTTVGVLLLVGLVSALLVRLQRKSRQEAYRIEIENAGNVSSRYQLRVDGAGSDLKFRWTLNGVVLEEVPVFADVPVEEFEEVPVQQAPRPSRRGGGMRQGLEGAMRTSGDVISALGAVGGLIPGKAGGQVRRVSSRVQSARGTASRVTYASDKVAGTVSGGSPRPSYRSSSGATKTVRRKKIRPTVSYVWNQTPFVGPGETLTVDLRVDPVHLSRTQWYSFRIISRSVEDETPPTLQDRQFQVKGISWLSRFFPFLLIFAAGAVLLWALFQLLMSVAW